MSRIPTLPNRLSKLKPALPVVTNSSWRSGKTSSERGYGWQWTQYRARYLSEHPLCEYCLKEDRVTVAQVVDHKVPHQGDMELFWDVTNHMPLCTLCHNSTKAKEEHDAGYRSYRP